MARPIFITFPPPNPDVSSKKCELILYVHATKKMFYWLCLLPDFCEIHGCKPQVRCAEGSWYAEVINFYHSAMTIVQVYNVAIVRKHAVCQLMNNEVPWSSNHRTIYRSELFLMGARQDLFVENLSFLVLALFQIAWSLQGKYKTVQQLWHALKLKCKT